LPSAAPKQNLLQISPPEVIFQNFDTHDVSEMTVSLMNVDKFPHAVKVCMERSPYFQLTGSNDAYRLLLPGASALVCIRFTPEENKDYSHELVCVTERERIVVPIRAIGAQAVLDFPEQLDFSRCPVKRSTQKTLLRRSSGNQAAHYQLSTQRSQDVINGLIHRTANTAQSCEETLHTNLSGEAVDVNAELNTNFVEFEKIYITKSSHTTIFVENKSNITAHFQWKTFPAEEDENQEKRRQCLFLQSQSELCLEELMEEKETGKEKGSCEDRAALPRAPEEKAKVHQDPMFSDDVFFIEPMEGEIGPNCSAEIKVTFKPLEAVEYQSVAYCSISGCESRLPLHLTGEGQGPLVELSSPTLNLGNVSVGTPHVSEVELINLGAIDAPFTCIPSTANMGFCFKFAPEEGIIAAGGTQTIQISFSATVVGTFEEEFQFSVAGSLMSAILTIKLRYLRASRSTKIPCPTDTSLVHRTSLYEKGCYPNLKIHPSSLEFGCLTDGAEEEVRSLEMTNYTSLPVHYQWSIYSESQKCRSMLMAMLFPGCGRYSSKFTPQPPKEKRPCVGSLAHQRRCITMRSVEKPVRALKEEQDFIQSSGAEAFSIEPQSGVLQPGESQQVSFTFSGHQDILAGVKALCHMGKGLTYEVELIAARVSYSLSRREIDCGLQIFNEVGHSTVTLENTGRTEFSWVLKPCPEDKHRPGVFLVKPTTGSIAPGKKKVLKFYYLPGLPGAFSRIYQLEVGDLEPETIFLKGEATCPMISVNLPWIIKENEEYEKPLGQPVKHPQQYNQSNKLQVVQKKTQSLKTQPLETGNQKTRDLQPRLLGSGTAPSTQLQMHKVRMLVTEAALELQEKLTYHAPKSRFPEKKQCQSLVKVELPEYVLDMGTVLKGFSGRSTLRITNPGQIPVCFQVNGSVLQGTGFSVDLGLMKSLPPRQSVAFDVCFESAQRPQGDVDVLLPIEVTKGPTSHIRLHATVLEVSLNLSKRALHFSDILVGQCKVETIRLYNWFQVPCTWSITAIKPVPKNKYIHHKLQALEDEPCPFEVTPSQGTLDPGRWQNLQIQFTPKEERPYKNELKLNVCGSSNHLKLHLTGQGLEPRLEFSPPALKMGRVLVDSNGMEATVVVKNPCDFPIEFYSLDFDQQYLEEEKILRIALGSEHQKSFLMPPRAVGGTLPPEVLEKYEAQERLKTQEAELKKAKKVNKKAKQNRRGQRSLQSSRLETQSEVTEEAARDEHVGVPCLDMQVADPKATTGEILSDGNLPTEDQMLKHLGQHPKGPPLPPAAVLSIVEYPEERLGPAERVEPFTIVAPEGAAMEDNLAKAPDVEGSSAKGQTKMGKATSRNSSTKENLISTQRTESLQDSSTTRSKTLLESASVPTEFLRLKRYRWIVPAHGQVELKVHFSTKKPGKFEQTLRFELVQSKRQYELPCSGTGLYPNISRSPRVVFPQWRKTMQKDEVIFKEYVESTKQFHFGPLLCGKSREWYKAQNCPSNSENLTILNNSPADVEVQFSFENAGEAETFLLDPPSMTLKPKEKQELTIWAYPTSPGFLEDKLICSIGKNPDPVVFSLCCRGVDMKLEVSPLELSFDRLLLHRTDSRTLVLRNNTLLPMAWQLRGLDDLFEDFSFSQDKGIIDPHTEFPVTLHFQAEQIGSIKKTLRLEVSDTENILGIAQAENIEISAEVYDASLSIDMPEGPDGILEFGTINVQDNVKKVLSLKNTGVYNIEYRFTLEGAGPRMASYFTVEPQSGVLIASQPGVNVEMLFNPKREMFLRNKPILYCQVIDASSGEGGQAVANIPVRVSAKAEYSKYTIEPASPINFGAMIKGTKKTQTVMLENKGMLSFKFYICQAPKEALGSKSSKQVESTKRSMRRKSSSLTQSHLSLGMFTVSPCSGSISPWGQQKITVECLAGQEGTCEEQLYIDIPGRDPKDNPLGIPFTLIAQSCLPALVEDVASIFEEYPICSSTDLDHKLLSVEGTGLFVRDENRFIFSKVQVGQEAEAHFHIYNASCLPCDVVLSIKALPGEEKSPINNIFKLHPVKMSVPGSSRAIATVTFTPAEEQNYNCTFKASLVIPKGSVEIKPQALTFTISGKGHEPQLTVVCPSARSKRGNAVLRFKRLRLGDSEILPLLIRNDGIIPVKFTLCLEDEHRMFSLKGRASALEVFHTGDVEEDSAGNESKPTKPFFLLNRGQSAEFDAIFKPTLAQRVERKIGVLVGDTYSNKIIIELVGEGHQDEFTLNGLEEGTEERNADGSLKKNIIDAVRVNHIQFGDCHVGEPYCRTFTITSHAEMVMRFEWEADAPFQFSPKVGHLHPGCAKDITVTLRSDVPVTFRRHLVKCKVTKIDFELPQRQVQDWDDQMSIVMWKDTTRKDPAARWPKIEKVVKTVPEPAHTVVEMSSQVEVYLSAIVAYAQFQLNAVMVRFTNTLPFETRTATSVCCRRRPCSQTLYFLLEESRFLSYDTMKYHRKLLRLFWWEQDHPLETPPKARRLRRPAKQQQDSELEQDSEQQEEQDPELQEEQPEQQQQEQRKQQDHSKKLRRSKDKNLSPKRASSSLDIFPDVMHDLFSISPCDGTIPPGQKQTFHLQFHPKCTGNFKTTLLCRIPNLEPTQKMGKVIVKGRVQECKNLDESLEQMEEGQGPKVQVLWRPPPEGQRLCELEHPAGAGDIVPSADDDLPLFTRDVWSCPPKLQEHLYLSF
ncbi:hydrocephalus-inducing protein homolog, partial [Onychostruthus taczanowskii]|uniref:hydrocephalus-inducing protein homolog n=1 Tax=Onychostruthus taczanowskii TaxID=356909 RepID=UPI001B80E4AC